VISRDELVAALQAQAFNVEVQVRLDRVPLDIVGVGLDERRGVILLSLDDDESLDALRRFLSRVTPASNETIDPGIAVRRNARGHFELLQAGRDD
jgi:hypothetical protein